MNQICSPGYLPHGDVLLSMKQPIRHLSLLAWCLFQLFTPLNALSQEHDLERLLKEAMTRFNGSDYTVAEDLFAQILKASPNHPEACLYMGFIKYYRGSASDVEVAKWWSRGLRAGGKIPGNRASLVKARAAKLSEFGQQSFAAKRYDRAREYFELARNLDPQLPEIESMIKRVNDTIAGIDSLVRRGEESLRRGEWQAAEGAFSRALELDPRNKDAEAGRAHGKLKVRQMSVLEEGFQKLKLWNLSGAEESFQQARMIDSSSSEVRQHLLMLDYFKKAEGLRGRSDSVVSALTLWEKGLRIAREVFPDSLYRTVRQALSDTLRGIRTEMIARHDIIYSKLQEQKWHDALGALAGFDSIVVAFDAVTGDSLTGMLRLEEKRQQARRGLDRAKLATVALGSLLVVLILTTGVLVYVKRHGIWLWWAHHALKQQRYEQGYRRYKDLYRRNPKYRQRICRNLAEHYSRIGDDPSVAAVFSSFFPQEFDARNAPDSTACDAIQLYGEITAMQLQQRGLSRQEAADIAQLRGEALRKTSERQGRKVLVAFEDPFAHVAAQGLSSRDYRDYYASLQELLNLETWEQLKTASSILDKMPQASLSRTEVPGEIHNVCAALQKYEQATGARDKVSFLTAGLNAIEAANQAASVRLQGAERELFAEILLKWRSVLAREMDELRGRAYLIGKWKAAKLVHHQINKIRLEIENRGLGTAEDIRVSIETTGVVDAQVRVQSLSILQPEERNFVDFDVSLPAGEAQNHGEVRIPFAIAYTDSRKNQVVYRDASTFSFFEAPYVPIKENPYFAGKPVRDARMFFGREDVFDFIRRNIDRNVILINGERRAGKTSLLYQLAEPNAISPDHIFVFIDIMGIAGVDSAGLLFALMRETHRTLDKAGVNIAKPVRTEFEENPFRAFSDFAETLGTAVGNKTIVLMLDEFENLQEKINRRQLQEDIFEYLRSVMEHKCFKFILIGTYRLDELTSSYWPVFTQIAVHYSLGRLEPEAAKALITNPIAGYVQYDSFALDRIVNISACHPYFTQLLCHFLLEHLIACKKNSVSASDVEDVIDRTVTGGAPHLMFIYNTCTAPEQLVLSAVAEICGEGEHVSRKQIEKKLRLADVVMDESLLSSALKKLVGRNILVWQRQQESYRFNIELIRRWVYRNKPLYNKAQGEID